MLGLGIINCCLCFCQISNLLNTLLIFFQTGLTPLMEAANGGYVDVGELLLTAGADPNTAPVPTSRDTALTIAADKGHHKFVEMLIHARAQVRSFFGKQNILSLNSQLGSTF